MYQVYKCLILLLLNGPLHLTVGDVASRDWNFHERPELRRAATWTHSKGQKMRCDALLGYNILIL